MKAQLLQQMVDEGLEKTFVLYQEEVKKMVEPSLGSREHDFLHAFACWPIADGHPLSLRPSSALGVRGQGTRTEFT